ncbi:MAG: hypothetical protein WD356_06200 [Pseudomonadales bacterium]
MRSDSEDCCDGVFPADGDDFCDDGLELDEDGLELGDDGLELGEDGLELGDDGLELGEGGLELGGVDVCGDWHPARDRTEPNARIFNMLALLIIIILSLATLAHAQSNIYSERPELLLNIFPVAL